MKLATLICTRDLAPGAQGLRTLLAHCVEVTELLVFEDGTLTPEDREVLGRALPKGRIIPRLQADQEMSQHLARHPHCQQFRRENPLGLKLLDVPLLGGSGVPYFDSDLLFFRPFSLAQIEAVGARAYVFMEDLKEGYSGRLPDLILKHRLAMPSKLNTGFIRVPAGRYDLDFVEWFLGRAEFRVFPQLVEQTCWAALAGKGVTRYLNPRQVYLAGEPTCIHDETLAVHFYAQHKPKIDGFFSQAMAAAGQGRVVELSSVPAPQLGLGRMAVNTVKNRWRQMRARLKGGGA